MRKIASTIALAAALLVPATADAHVLTKHKARGTAVRAANDICDRMRKCVDVTVQRPNRCDRRSRHSVECLYMLTLSNGIECFDTVRVTQHTAGGRLSYTFPYPDDTVCE